MPSLGFLKKKRTKDSQGSASDFTPTSPVTDKPNVGSPITPTFSKNSAFAAEPESASATDSAAPSSAPGTSAGKKSDDVQMTPAPQSQGGVQPASANSQNVPSIQNLINKTENSGSQHDSAYSSGDAHNMNVPHINAPPQKPTSNPVRETKGKYTLQDFQIQRTLGTGSFGRVHLVQSKHNQRFYAVKVLKKAQVVKMKQVEHTNDERRMLQRCRHPFLITLWGTWQDSKNLYMVMDFIEGGELFSLLRKSQVRHSSAVETVKACELTFSSASQIPSPSSTQPK
jgi:protein kinase A